MFNKIEIVVKGIILCQNSKNMKMKNILYLVFIVMMSCSTDNPTTTYTIKGDVTNLKDDLIYAKIEGSEPVYLDTIKVVDGKFDFTTPKLKENDFRFLIPISNQKEFIKIFVDNSDLNIKGSSDSLSFVTISGSENHTLYDKLMKEYEAIDKESQLLGLELQMARNDEDGVSATNIQEKLYENEDKKPKLFIDFAKSNPNSNVSAWALLQIVPFVEYNQIAPVYDSLSDEVKASKYSRNLKMILDDLSKTAIGAKAPKFSLPNVKGDIVSLDDFKGKITLIDFWSPMCVYCKLENPHIVKLYNTYKDKGLNIVGINVDGDTNLDIWELVIEEQKLAWTQLRDTMGVADVYKVNNTPYNILVDANGVIIAKDLHQEELDKKLAELFK